MIHFICASLGRGRFGRRLRRPARRSRLPFTIFQVTPIRATTDPLPYNRHTSLVLFGLEVFYGQGISVVSPPGTTHVGSALPPRAYPADPLLHQHGTPHKQLDMGSTQLDKEMFLSYIEGVREVYSADRYHLLDFNCNSFTNDVLGFLNGRGIPSDILSTSSPPQSPFARAHCSPSRQTSPPRFSLPPSANPCAP